MSEQGRNNQSGRPVPPVTIASRSSWIESAIGSPADRPDDWVIDCLQFGAREIRLARPRDPDRLLDDPAVLCASLAHDYMPYWAYLWPGAVLLADAVLCERWPAGLHALEIGCGLGLAGLAALAAGLRVTFSDYSPAALELAAHNARLNGLDQFDTCTLDWRDPAGKQYKLVLGADVLYEQRCLTEVLGVLDAVLAPGGTALLSDSQRSVADPFLQLASARGYSGECVPAVSQVGGRTIQGRIFRLSGAQ